MTCPNGAAAKELETGLQASAHKRDHELEEVLTCELMGQRKPRSKTVAKSVLKSAMAQMPG